MTNLLDLVITLSPPPTNSSPNTIARIGLNCAALGAAYEGDLLSDPLTAEEYDLLRWYLEEYWQ